MAMPEKQLAKPGGVSGGGASIYAGKTLALTFESLPEVESSRPSRGH